MLKKVMFLLMALVSAVRLASLGYLLNTAPGHLPRAVCISGGLVGAAGVLVLALRILRPVGLRVLEWFYLALEASVLFNLAYIKLSSRIALDWLDLGVIGTLFELAAGLFLYCLSVRERHYTGLG